MIEINLFDQSFVGQPCSVAAQTPRTMRYVRGRMQWDGITVFTGQMLFDPIVDDVQSRFKIGWLNGDAWCLRPESYDRAPEVAHKFDAIMTHSAELLTSGPPFIKTIRGGSWVPLDQWGMEQKTKNVSMILSDKITLPGHTLRHAIARAGLPIDLYGPGYAPIGHDKRIAYQDYRYAVVVEACQEVNWFTEHLLDALAFGCVPIYWGCPNIADYFPFGLAPFNDMADLGMRFHSLGLNWEGAYQFYGSGVKMAQEQSRAYAITEDWQIANCLRPYVEAL